MYEQHHAICYIFTIFFFSEIIMQNYYKLQKSLPKIVYHSKTPKKTYIINKKMQKQPRLIFLLFKHKILYA